MAAVSRSIRDGDESGRGISIADLLALRQTWDDELANLRAHILSLRTKIATVDVIVDMARRAAVTRAPARSRAAIAHAAGAA